MEKKSCPFCGGKPHIASEYEPYSESGGKFYWVRCGSCRSQSAKKYASHGNDCHNLYAEVWDEWNQRFEQNPSEADRWLNEATEQRARADLLQMQVDELSEALNQARRIMAYAGKLQ
jgi:hypothetical protein